ncbi:hypothetical protein ACFQAS_11485 [Halopenitus salinus]|uniref:DNA helicase n=1 Tax=Halopenitus salinus TaxID=1198295 RepID=A0ABD5UXG2_9EURY
MTTGDPTRPSPSILDPDVPVAELVAPTRRAEARAAMALVAGLRDAGVAVRDLAVVARDLDDYEEPLYRAAVQCGIAPVFWTQLRVTRTRPFALIESVCGALDARELDAETLSRPLEHRWCPPGASGSEWPIDPAEVQRMADALPDGSRPPSGWRAAIRSTPCIDDRSLAYLEWLEEQPAPSPKAVTSVLGDVLEAYERLGLPVTKARDSPALLETERDARGVVRVRTLVRQLRHKYDDRLADGTVERSWGDVAELAGLIATQRPGRREHSNARAVDVLEANDVWQLDVPYVIAVGLVDGEWPRKTESALPPELCEEILAGTGRSRGLAPRPAWTDGRDRDQLDDVIRAAGNGLVVTRHAETTDGEERRRSYLLERLDPERIPDDERRRLVAPDRELPRAVHGMRPGGNGGAAPDE